jgi:hypothetical protein
LLSIQQVMNIIFRYCQWTHPVPKKSKLSTYDCNPVIIVIIRTSLQADTDSKSYAYLLDRELGFPQNYMLIKQKGTARTGNFV